MRAVDASPLIHLAHDSLLEILRGRGQGEDVIVPANILEEVRRGTAYDLATELAEAAVRDWLTAVPASEPHPRINRAQIDDGELAVFSVALATPGSTLVLDDRAARAEADRLGLSRTGNLGLLLEAKVHGLIPPVRAPLELLRGRGMHLSDEIRLKVLSLAGE